MKNPTLWTPSKMRADKTQMRLFLRKINEKYRQQFSNYRELHQWSIKERELFWKELFSFFSIDYEGELDPVRKGHDFKTYGWFPRVRLNFAKNLLSHGRPENTALNFIHESGLKKEISYRELSDLVGKFQRPLRKFIKKGDVLASYMPNIPETVISMLGAGSLGAVFTSASSDYGAVGVLDRFKQVGPKVLVAACGYEYNGKYFDNLEIIKTLEATICCIQKIIVVDFLKKRPSIDHIPKSVFWEDFLDHSRKGPEFVNTEFSHPLYIVYSSGTTGMPKCIVHTQGGVLLQHVKELGLHTGLTEEKQIFYFTTCGWMMWNWLVSSLFFGSKVLLYDGSPSYPGLGRFFSMIDRERITIFGTSPKFLRVLEKTVGNVNSDLSSLETILSTGSPLLPEQFDYVYRNIKEDIHLASISGGTDIIGCFALGNPMESVRRGEIQCPGLGMDVDCFDENGRSVRDVIGELVCKTPFPSCPLSFLNDSDNKLYHKSYFYRWDNIWCHGDHIKMSAEGGIGMYGRSDATLNPGGVRIGTAEIYGQVEHLPYIEDSLCVAKKRRGDVGIYLFVKMKNNEDLSIQRIREIKMFIRNNTTSRHVPKEIFSVKDIPYTRSGKKMELIVAKVINSKESVDVLQSMANPGCLDEYKKFAGH